jgi:DNA-binding MarR family transcriptional regulator
LVSRRDSRADGRVTIVEITTLGRQRIKTLLQAATAREAFARAALGEPQLHRLKSLLQRLLQARAVTLGRVGDRTALQRVA